MKLVEGGSDALEKGGPDRGPQHRHVRQSARRVGSQQGACLHARPANRDMDRDRRTSLAAHRRRLGPLCAFAKQEESVALRRQGLGRDRWSRGPIRCDLRIALRTDARLLQSDAIRSVRMDLERDRRACERTRRRRFEALCDRAERRLDLGVLPAQGHLDEHRRPGRHVRRRARHRLRPHAGQESGVPIHRDARAVDEGRRPGHADHRWRIVAPCDRARDEGSLAVLRQR